MYYNAQISYIYDRENHVKDIIYHATTDINAVRDAVAFANRLERSFDGSANLTHIRIKEYIIASIDSEGNVIAPICPMVFSWNCKDIKVIKKFLKDMRKKREDDDFRLEL